MNKVALTVEEIADLPDGSDIDISWGGDRAPLRYKLRFVEEYGTKTPYAIPFTDHQGEFWPPNLCDFRLDNTNHIVCFGSKYSNAKVYVTTTK